MSEYIVKAADWAIDDKGESLFKGCEEIVRCRDCKHLIAHGAGCAYWDYCDIESTDGFCAWGERKKRMSYEFGDWVVYDPGYKQQIGRVTECREGSAFVCYSLGCTAASTPLEYLRPATDAEVAQADPMIGFNRFHEYCPSWDEWACVGCKARKGE